MEAKLDFYAEWFRWLEAKSSEMTHAAPLGMYALLKDVSELIQKDIRLWNSLAEAIHGNGLQIAMHVGTWAAEHGDPLKETRETMRAIRARYGEVKGAKK